MCQFTRTAMTSLNVSVLFHSCPGVCIRTLRKLCFHFLSRWMGYDRGDSFPFDFEPNVIPFGSKSKGKYPIQCERNWKYSFFWCIEKKRDIAPETTIRSGGGNEDVSPIRNAHFTILSIVASCHPLVPNQKNNNRKQSYTQRNLIESNLNEIVFTIFRLIWIQTDFRSVLNQSEYGEYNLI